MATVRDDEHTTVIGKSMQVRGNLAGDEDLQVLGRVDGSIDLQRTLIVAESGIVKAEVSVKNAIISGIVVGNVRASESVELTRDGRMVGDISAPRIIIVDGASFRGNIDMGDMENMPARPARTERKAPAPPPRRAEPTKSTTTARAESRTVVDKTERAEKPAETRVDAKIETKGEQKTGERASDAPKAADRERTEVVTSPARGSLGGLPPPRSGGPSFLEPPPAKSLPKKQKHRVVVKRK
jgi:cytoskeletal protein CcmA (bactofilin family)